ncbi:hypothetical protein ACFOGI_00735 [Virgibacillus xinjiangensis]|uniref:DUF2304 domain-containing protein n=1 Tax=Virgibacillus xinjiangensis TaxID=393090 RepID=A0ABV7CQT9_9BACI
MSALWIMFFLILLVTLASAVYYIIQGRNLKLSYWTVVVPLLLPVVMLLFTAQRPRDMTGWGHFWSQFIDGNIWTVLILAGFLYLATWWILFFEAEEYLVSWYKEIRNRIRNRIRKREDSEPEDNRSRQSK